MIKKFIRWFFNLSGFEIRRKLTEKQKDGIGFRQFIKENRWLIDYDFKTIIDIGANEGQFAHKIRRLFPEARIISFEPLPNVYEILRESFKNDFKFTSYNLALGTEQGKSKMWLNEFNPASSLLELKQHLNHFEFAKNERMVDIDIMQLDQILDVSNLEKPYLVKIDVQGYEENVIKGGKDILSDAKMIITEVSFVHLYKDHLLFDGIYSLLRGLGFRHIGNFDQLRSPIDNLILQADAIFIK